MKRSWTRTTTVGILAVLSAASTASAGAVDEAALAATMLGFDLQGRHNLASGGIDFVVAQSFNGSTLDFGAGDLTLQGPLSFNVNTGGRIVPTLDLSLTTAVNADASATPLSYNFSLDPANNPIDVSGNLLLDANFSINRLGFYDLDITASSRQTVHHGNDPLNDVQNDFDVGPVRIAGNVYLDLLAAVTDPIFDANGRPNPFAQLSGQAKFPDVSRLAADELQQALASGLGESTTASLMQLLAGTTSNPSASATSLGVDPALSSRRFGNVGSNVVPEPTVLLLMLVGLPVVLARTSERRRHAAR